MAKLCALNVIESVNMKVYNFLMRLNETRNVLWNQSCKCVCVCVCRLNSSVCNSKQIWNSDTCSSDCNEDFAGIMTCNKGYMWNPNTCAWECDMWCKPGQYLDYKKCVCKNKLIGKVISKCTSFINESMMSNKTSIVSHDTTKNIFIVFFFQYLCLLELLALAYLLILSGLKVKNYLKKDFRINILMM